MNCKSKIGAYAHPQAAIQVTQALLVQESRPLSAPSLSLSRSLHFDPVAREAAEARIFATTCLECFAVNLAPNAKRANGPNELADASPAIYRLGTDVSK